MLAMPLLPRECLGGMLALLLPRMNRVDICIKDNYKNVRNFEFHLTKGQV